MQEAMQDSPEVNLMQPYLIVTPTRFPDAWGDRRKLSGELNTPGYATDHL
jgi:hypothetical protein